jgi:hypothetical protein
VDVRLLVLVSVVVGVPVLLCVLVGVSVLVLVPVPLTVDPGCPDDESVPQPAKATINAEATMV